MSNKEKILAVAVLILLAAASFGLGYLIRGEVKKSPILIEKYSNN